jgi:hypothetical protein
MAFGIVMLVISMGTRPFMPNLTMVTILEFFNGAGSVIDYITPFSLREYYEMEYSEVMASVKCFLILCCFVCMFVLVMFCFLFYRKYVLLC